MLGMTTEPGRTTGEKILRCAQDDTGRRSLDCARDDNGIRDGTGVGNDNGEKRLLMNMQTNDSHILVRLTERYPQLALPVEEGMSKSDEFRRVIYRGEPTDRVPRFHFSPEDNLTSYETPAGTAEVLYIADREDFEHAYRALAYRCEPTPILASVGAVTLSGLIDWKKIRDHEKEYLAAGGTDWGAEFNRFTADKSNYLDTIILLSGGEYSAVPAERIGMSREEWLEKSVTIRKFHELTHFICRKLWIEKKEALRDEIYADCIGLIAAFGEYRTDLAKLFLGIESETYRKGGRLEHYIEGAPPEAQQRAADLIREADEKVGRLTGSEGVFDILKRIY